MGFFRKKTGADTAKRKPNGAVNNDDDDGDNDTYPPSGKFQGPMTINGEGTMDAGETDGTAGERKKGVINLACHLSSEMD